jgi:hypothetical protein
MQQASSLRGTQRGCAPFSSGKPCFRTRFAAARNVAAQAAADPLLLRVARGEGEQARWSGARSRLRHDGGPERASAATARPLAPALPAPERAPRCAPLQTPSAPPCG